MFPCEQIPNCISTSTEIANAISQTLSSFCLYPCLPEDMPTIPLKAPQRFFSFSLLISCPRDPNPKDQSGCGNLHSLTVSGVILLLTLSSCLLVFLSEQKYLVIRSQLSTLCLRALRGTEVGTRFCINNILPALLQNGHCQKIQEPSEHTSQYLIY